jgi:hypothetical protein
MGVQTLVDPHEWTYELSSRCGDRLISISKLLRGAKLAKTPLASAHKSDMNIKCNHIAFKYFLTLLYVKPMMMVCDTHYHD